MKQCVPIEVGVAIDSGGLRSADSTITASTLPLPKLSATQNLFEHILSSGIFAVEFYNYEHEITVR